MPQQGPSLSRMIEKKIEKKMKKLKLNKEFWIKSYYKSRSIAQSITKAQE